MSRIVIHNYRWRLGLAEGEARYDALERRLAQGPSIAVPTITLEGDANGAPHPDPGSLSGKIHRALPAPLAGGRDRPQSAAGSPARFCRGRARGDCAGISAPAGTTPAEKRFGGLADVGAIICRLMSQAAGFAWDCGSRCYAKAMLTPLTTIGAATEC